VDRRVAHVASGIGTGVIQYHIPARTCTETFGMLAPAMRVFITAMALIVIVCVASVTWLTTRGPNAAQAARIAAALQSTAPPDEPAAYAHCASCHLHDGSGRPDGSIPQLNGQRRAVLENKLHRLRTGMMHLPVMDAYARTLAPREVTEIAAYLSELPQSEAAQADTSERDRAEGASLYTQHCSACHGANGEGHDGLFASRLCGQYPAFLERRLDEIVARKRGDADAIMQGVVDVVPGDDLRVIVAWLAGGKGCAVP
jgi:cytochrome c553